MGFEVINIDDAFRPVATLLPASGCVHAQNTPVVYFNMIGLCCESRIEPCERLSCAFDKVEQRCVMVACNDELRNVKLL